MEDNLPEEIVEKLKIIEEENEYFKKIKPPQSVQIVFGIVFLLIGIGILIKEKNLTFVSYLIAGLFFFLGYFDYKRLYNIHSNACDIIKYYRNKVVIKKTEQPH